MQDLVELYRRWQVGDSPRRIAKALGMSRNTVRVYVRSAEEAGVKRDGGWDPEQWAVFVRERFPETEDAGARAVWWTELDRYREDIGERLKQNRVTTVWRRMHDQEKKIGASLSTFRRYVHARFPAAVDPGRVVIHGVESEPGELAEVDFGRLGRVTEPVSGKARTLWAFIMVMVHSRHLFVAPVFSMDRETWLDCHLRGLRFFNGCMRRIVLDNLRDGVLKADIYDPVLNRAYGELGRYYDILLDPARSGEPTDKPHVERVVPFVREHLFRGREERFPDLQTGAAWAEQWCVEEAGSRIHRTTGRRPLELFTAAEAPVLRPLPAQPWESCVWERTRVARDSCCLAAGARYSVPWRFLEQTLDARVTAKGVEFYRETELVKTHPRVPRGTRRLDDADLPPERISFFRRTAPWCREQAARLGPNILAAVTELLQVGTNSRLRQAQRLLDLESTFGAARLNAACARACAFGDPGYRTIKNILVAGLDQHPGEVPMFPLNRPTRAGAFLRGQAAFAADGDEPPAGAHAAANRRQPVETDPSTPSAARAPAGAVGAPREQRAASTAEADGAPLRSAVMRWDGEGEVLPQPPVPTMTSDGS